MADEGTIRIRSYRVCFDLERRIHKIDRWRIPLPYGLPLRGIVYFLAALGAVLVARPLPIAGGFLDTLHPALRYFALPVGTAVALMRWTIDGRTPHATAKAWLRMRLSPRRLCAFRPAPATGPVRFEPITIVPDESSPRLRRAVVHGPATVTLRYAAQLHARARTLRVVSKDGPPLWQGKTIELKRGQRMVIR
jgi:hypothetical protein